MKRTAFLLIFLALLGSFGVFGQETVFSFPRFSETEARGQEETDYENIYSDPFDIQYNDPLINADTNTSDNQIVQDDVIITRQESAIEKIDIEPRQNEAAVLSEQTTAQSEQSAPPAQTTQSTQSEQSAQPVQTTQPAQTVPVLQPASPMPPAVQPAQSTQTVQPGQSVQSSQSVQPAPLAAPAAARTTQAQTSHGIIPLTWEIVNLIQSSNISLKDLNYYLSKSFTMVISEQYDNPKIEIKNGALVLNEQQQASQMVFTNSQIGKLHGFPVSGSIDVFEVVFKSADKDVAMRFRKTQSNIFELYSAVINTRPYTLHSDEGMPQLSINSNMGRGDSEVQAYPTPNAAGRSRNVEGQGSLNKNGVLQYIKTQKPPLSDSEIERIIQTYFDEAAFENINHDIAIAQMLHASNFFKNDQRVSGFNYSGLIELPNWQGKFSSMTEGVRAHIQHVKGYASKTLNRQQIADPRYYLLVNLNYLGTVKTFDQLYEKWTASPAAYKQNIERILDGLYQYCPR